MSSPPWMPLYIADYLADTSHLTTIEHGAYLLLIMHYWRVGCLPAEDHQLSRICRMTPRQWSAARATMAAFFDIQWRHHRIDEELSRAAEKSAARATSGKNGGEAKALKDKEARLANVTILPQQNTADAIASSSQPPEKKETEAKASLLDLAADPVPAKPTSDWPVDGFKLWYDAYPRKRHPDDATKAFAKVRRSGRVGFEDLMAATVAYAARAGPDKQFLPYPASWLNAGGWADEPEPETFGSTHDRTRQTTDRRSESRLTPAIFDDLRFDLARRANPAPSFDDGDDCASSGGRVRGFGGGER